MLILPPYSRREDEQAAKRFKVFGFGDFYKSPQWGSGRSPEKENTHSLCRTLEIARAT